MYLEELATSAFRDVLGTDAPALLKSTQDENLGDYQINGALPLAKKLGKNPRELAELVATSLRAQDAILSAEVAGPGFVNLKLSAEFLGKLVSAGLASENQGVDSVAKPETIVVDYSGPNIAKQMHVGHLRSTIIGQAIANLLRFVGHKVVADNHVGDWGTQYGMLIAGLRKFGDPNDAQNLSLAELEKIYKEASELSKNDESFADAARAELAKLQQGDAENHALWERFVDITKRELMVMYERLQITFDTWLGESAYENQLAGVVDLLLERGLAREDQGAICVFFSEWPAELQEKIPAKLRKQEVPFIVRKKDGAFLYSTTDIATVIHRREAFAADRAVYVVDSRQALHFEQLFAVMMALGYSPTGGEKIKLTHVGFGTILGSDGRPLKTRDASGNVVTLAKLLDEAEEKARELLVAQGVDIPEGELETAARKVGIGAVKYADLRQNRMSDYQFDFDKMLEFKGNAGPYLQYATARVAAIFRKAEKPMPKQGLCIPEEAAERSLARQLAKFSDAIHQAAETAQPHLLTDHLYEVARCFSAFYEQCPILKSEGEVRERREVLAAAAFGQLSRGLSLLGIEILERM